MAMAARRALPVSPMLDRLQSGGLPELHAPSSHSVPVMAAAFWSVPGRSDLGPFSYPRVLQ